MSSIKFFNGENVSKSDELIKKVYCKECNNAIEDAIYYGEGNYWHKECSPPVDLQKLFQANQIGENMSTVKVKIAVVVDPQGHWVSAGWAGTRDRDLMDTAIDSVRSGEARYWITAELEIPESKTKKIKGKVENAN